VEEKRVVLWLQKLVLSLLGHNKNIVIILLDWHIFNVALGSQ